MAYVIFGLETIEYISYNFTHVTMYADVKITYVYILKCRLKFN